MLPSLDVLRFDMLTTIVKCQRRDIWWRMRSITNENVKGSASEREIGRVILKDVLVVAIAIVAIISLYFLVKAFSIIANIPP